MYETRWNDSQLQFNQSQSERKKLGDEKRELEKEVDRLKAQLDDARKHLEEETLQRIDLENNIQTLKEDISFKDQVYQQELTETRTRRQVSNLLKRQRVLDKLVIKTEIKDIYICMYNFFYYIVSMCTIVS